MSPRTIKSKTTTTLKERDEREEKQEKMSDIAEGGRSYLYGTEVRTSVLGKRR